MRRTAALLSPLALLISCDRSTGPEAPFVPDPVQLQRAAVIHVAIPGDSAVVSSTASAGLASVAVTAHSVLGRDAIEARATSVTRTSVNGRRDLVRFDLAIVNGIAGYELRSPTGLPAPAGAPGSVFAYPYAATVTGGTGAVDPSSDWDGAAFDFFAVANCGGGQRGGCFPWEAFVAPLRPGQASPSRTVGFLVDKKVTSFDVYVLVSADLVAVPTGSVDVTVISSVRGPLSAVSVLMDAGIEAVTNTSGVARFASAVAGTRSIAVTAPAGCIAPAPTTAAVIEGQTTALTIDVTCAPAELRATESVWDFGTTFTSATSAPRIFVFSNTGGSTSSPITVSLTGDNAADFLVSNDQCSNASLAPGSACTVDVALHPTGAGSRTASLTVSAAEAGPPAHVGLIGTGVVPAQLAVDVATFNFGAEGIGGTTAPSTFTVRNTGGVASGPPSMMIAGPNGAEFAIVSNECTAALAAGASCAVSIVASPTSMGTKAATFTVSAAPGGAASVALAAEGVSAAVLESVAGSRDFGSVRLGEEGLLSVTFRNTGAWPSGPIAVALSGTDAAEFSTSATAITCGPRLAPGNGCVVTVRFHPTVRGNKTVSLSISATSGGTASVNLTALGLSPAAIAIDRTAHDFGGVANGFPAQTTFTISNTGDIQAPALVVAFAGENAADFTRDGGSCGVTLAGDASCTVIVEYNPGAMGPRSGTLTVSASPGGSVSAALSGRDLLTISETSVHFGTAVIPVNLGRTFTITNTGGSPTGRLTVSRSSSPAWAFDDQCTNRILAAGQSCQVQPIWVASTEGTTGISFTVSGDPGGSVGASVQGTAVTAAQGPASLNVSPGNGFNFGNVAVGSSATQTYTARNVGGEPFPAMTATFDPASTQYSIVNNNCAGSGPLAGGRSCTFDVRFAPTTTGHKSASLRVSAGLGVPGGTLIGSVIGFGTTPDPSAPPVPPAPPATPALLQTTPISQNLAVTVGYAVDAAFTLSNAGAEASGPLSVTLTQPAAPHYTIIANTCGATLPGRATCSVTVRYYPDEASPNHTATLAFSAAPGGSVSVPLTGVATAPIAATLWSPLLVDFGTVRFGEFADRAVVFKNVGLTEMPAPDGMNITSVGHTFQMLAPFDACFRRLSPGQSCTINVRFRPAEGGDLTKLEHHGSVGLVGPVSRSTPLFGRGRL